MKNVCITIQIDLNKPAIFHLVVMDKQRKKFIQLITRLIKSFSAW
jgi:hypothetical protein